MSLDHTLVGPDNQGSHAPPSPASACLAPPGAGWGALASGWLVALVAALLLLGVAARVRQFGISPSYWYDEAYLVINIIDLPQSELIGPLRANVVIPPAFLVVLRFLYEHLGSAEWVMRLPAFVAGLTGLFLFVPLARRVVAGRWWLVPLLLAAVSHHMLIHTYEVRPYTVDFLVTEAVLLAVVIHLDPATRDRGRAMATACLLVLALLGPWCSFPSVFVLGSASLVLLLDAWQRRTRASWALWVGLNAGLGLSVALLWWVQARHLYYPGLKEHWAEGWGGFPRNYAPGTVLAWSLRCLVGIGHYGTTGMGVPLAALAVLGAVSLWKPSEGKPTRALLLLLTAVPVLGWLAALLYKYPMGDRTVFFAVPCVWLLAALGVSWLARAFAGRGRWCAALVVAILLAPGVARTAKYCFVSAPKVDFRGAFAYLQQQRSGGDCCYVSHPEVYEVYFGKGEPCLGCYHSPPEVLTRVQGQRLWVVAPPTQSGIAGPWVELQGYLQSAGMVPVARHSVPGLEVVLYDRLTHLHTTARRDP